MGREKEMPLLARLCWLVLTFKATLGQKPLTGTAGQAVSLPCGSSSDCTWRKDGEELALEERSDQARFTIGSCALTIEPVLPGDEGMYECNNGKSRHRLTVLVEAGVPYIEEGKQGMVEVQEGHQAELHCVSQGGKPAAEIEWKRDGQSVTELDRIFEEVSSRLLIKNIEKKDFGEYACFAENQVGTDLAMTQLRVKTSVDILSVVASLTCILGGVLLIAIFVYIRLKKRCCGNLPEEKC